MKKVIFSMLGVALFLLLISGCGASNNYFTIAYLPVEDSTEVQEIRGQFQENLSEAIGMEVKEFQTTSYSAAIEAVSSGKVDMVMLTPFSYIVAKSKGEIELIADLTIPSAAVSEEKPYYSCFFSGKDSGIESLDDIKGKIIAFGDPVSTTGHLLPKYKLTQEFDLTVEEIENTYFKDVMFSGGHDKTVIGVAQGTYDVGAAYCEISTILEDKGVIESGDVKVIGGVGPESGISIGTTPLVVRSGLNDELKTSLQNFLYSYEDPAYFENIGAKGGAYVPGNETNYEGLKKLSDTLGLTEEDLLAD
ncbi:phosphate/phosphite/phosphonate ABC transporter substrate-binding protein [Culicoidibacter larvae]|uniref:Phosphate/phosphite/phosphonate ABC transporter substrate-binding protein n=1 Tax=Culicoidibacter larvae TaxID=2579976 RepID=A0A5R8QE66_9FIRM|nr:phosphate/phosphite/phosphonate ABC transporter substrate-binding protein [Culicoidibacter larvae]TLG75478.1 phosphate/phosphite/phosphonate ABC transporter substrate-binding protein [Culicoidibacter larvae]